MSVVLCRGSTCPLSRALDSCIPRRGTTSSCQSSCHFQDCKALLFFSCKQHYIKYPDLYLLKRSNDSGDDILQPRRQNTKRCGKLKLAAWHLKRNLALGNICSRSTTHKVSPEWLPRTIVRCHPGTRVGQTEVQPSQFLHETSSQSGEARLVHKVAVYAAASLYGPKRCMGHGDQRPHCCVQ